MNSLNYSEDSPSQTASPKPPQSLSQSLPKEEYKGGKEERPGGALPFLCIEQICISLPCVQEFMPSPSSMRCFNELEKGEKNALP